MALATYTDLKSAIASWMDRTDIAGNVDDFIDLGEAFLNRKLRAVSAEAALVTIAGNRLVDVSSLAIDQPVALFLDIGSEEVRLSRMEGAQSERDEIARRPQRWELDGSNIAFDAPADDVYNLRFEFDQRFALSDAAPTNDVLTKHPDLYLSACLVAGAKFTVDQELIATHKDTIRDSLPGVQAHYARRRKATLKVPPALLQHRYYRQGAYE